MKRRTGPSSIAARKARKLQAKLREQSALIAGQTNAAQAANSAQIEELRAQLDQAEATILSNSSAIVALQDDIAVLQAWRIVDEPKIAQLQADMVSAGDDITALQVDVGTLQTDVAEALKGERYSEYRCSGVADINASPPFKFTFSIAHAEDTTIASRAVSNTRVVINEDGVYRMDFRATYYSVTAFVGLFAYIQINGGTIVYAGAEGLVGGASAPFSSSNGSYQVQLSAGDYIEMLITRHAAATGPAYQHSDHTYLRLTKLGDPR